MVISRMELNSQVLIESWVIGSLMQDNHQISKEQGKNRDYKATDTLLDNCNDDPTIDTYAGIFIDSK